jgi:hypothetical protein
MSGILMLLLWYCGRRLLPIVGVDEDHPNDWTKLVLFAHLFLSKKNGDDHQCTSRKRPCSANQKDFIVSTILPTQIAGKQTPVLFFTGNGTYRYACE